MTPEKQRIKIAEACGWTQCPYNDTNYYVPINGTIATATDPLTDLNAMHEAEKVLTEAQRIPYVWVLDELTGMDIMLTFPILHATASQRAEAFLKTLRLWEDEQ
jgi:hypothetical protein